MTDVPWPYNLPIWQRSLFLDSPDGKQWASIENAVEVSMGNPTVGRLKCSNELQIENCNPSFIWSDDSKYIAVPQYVYSRFWGFGKQRLLVIDMENIEIWQSPKLAYYIQPASFEGGEIATILNPFKKPEQRKYNIEVVKTRFQKMR